MADKLVKKVSPSKSAKKFKIWMAGVFVAVGYHLLLMAYGAAVVRSGDWLSWDVMADTGVYFGELAKDICSKTPDAVATLRDATKDISTVKLDY
jgi:hypothetical protein